MSVKTVEVDMVEIAVSGEWTKPPPAIRCTVTTIANSNSEQQSTVGNLNVTEVLISAPAIHAGIMAMNRHDPKHYTSEEIVEAIWRAMSAAMKSRS